MSSPKTIGTPVHDALPYTSTVVAGSTDPCTTGVLLLAGDGVTVLRVGGASTNFWIRVKSDW